MTRRLGETGCDVRRDNNDVSDAMRSQIRGVTDSGLPTMQY
jgi:hypothetical protein